MGAHRRTYARRLHTVFVLVVLASLVAGAATGLRVPAGFSARAGGSSSAVHDASLCNNANSQTEHLAVWVSSCEATFGVEYAQNFSHLNATNHYTFTFALSWVAELTNDSQLISAANALEPYSGLANISYAGNVIDVYTWMLLDTVSATGNWTPNDTAWGSGPQWNATGPLFGQPTLGVLFQLQNATSNTSGNVSENPAVSVRFSLTVINWPWFSPFDHLGIELDSIGAQGNSFAFDNATRTLTESANSASPPFVNLSFEKNASISYLPGVNLNSSVYEQVGVFDIANSTPVAATLVDFPGPPPPLYYPGGYSRLIYDPWIVFSPGVVVNPPPLHSSAEPFPLPLLSVVIATVALAGGMVGIVVRIARNERLHREGTALLAGMREALEQGPEGPRGPR